jgi:hypothetical protein
METKTKRSTKERDSMEIQDEPGMAERFQRGLQRAFQTPHKPHPTPKAKTNKGPRNQ